MIATFLCLVSGGMMLTLSMGRLRETHPRFIRLVGMISLAVATVVVAWQWTHPPQAPTSVWWLSEGLTALAAMSAAALVLAGAASETATTVLRGISFLGGVAGVSAACLWIWTGPTPAEGPVGIAMVVVGQILAAMMLGSVTTAWLLGHAYLTATKMTIAPLRRLSGLFSLSVALRCLYLVVSMVLLRLGISAEAEPLTWANLMEPWLVMSLRVAVGLLATGVFAWMVSDCVRLRSTQSATGILYFASVFVYIGELSSQSLLADLGLPI
jgi:hypothetical protein